MTDSNTLLGCAQDDGDGRLGTQRARSIVSGYLNNSAKTVKRGENFFNRLSPTDGLQVFL